MTLVFLFMETHTVLFDVQSPIYAILCTVKNILTKKLRLNSAKQLHFFKRVRWWETRFPDGGVRVEIQFNKLEKNIFGKWKTLKRIVTSCRNTKICHVFVITRKMSLFLCKISSRRIRCFIIKRRKKIHYRGNNPMSEKRKNIKKIEEWKGNLDCRFIVVLLFTWCPDCHIYCIEGAINITETNNTNAEKYDVSFQTIWLTAENRQGSTILFQCINNNTCPINVTKQHSYVCLCTSGICAKIRCRGTYRITPLKIKCKIETETKEAMNCLSYPVIEQLSDYRIIDGQTSSVYNNETELSIFEGVKWKITEMSATETTSKCVTHRNAFIQLCFPEIYPCLLTSKGKLQKQKNESSTEAQNMHSNIWMYWKVKLILVFSGTMTFGVSLGCFFGMHFSRLRIMSRHIKRQKELRNYACHSELYTEIGNSLNNETTNEEESLSEQIELRSMTERRFSVSDDQSIGCISGEMDNSYSNIYNVLQPNYG